MNKKDTRIKELTRNTCGEYMVFNKKANIIKCSARCGHVIANAMDYLKQMDNYYVDVKNWVKIKRRVYG